MVLNIDNLHGDPFMVMSLEEIDKLPDFKKMSEDQLIGRRFLVDLSLIFGTLLFTSSS